MPYKETINKKLRQIDSGSTEDWSVHYNDSIARLDEPLIQISVKLLDSVAKGDPIALSFPTDQSSAPAGARVDQSNVLTAEFIAIATESAADGELAQCALLGAVESDSYNFSLDQTRPERMKVRLTRDGAFTQIERDGVRLFGYALAANKIFLTPFGSILSGSILSLTDPRDKHDARVAIGLSESDEARFQSVVTDTIIPTGPNPAGAPLNLNGLMIRDAGFQLASNEPGDIYYRAMDGSLERIPLGADGQILMVDRASSKPAWAAPQSSTANAGALENLYLSTKNDDGASKINLKADYVNLLANDASHSIAARDLDLDIDPELFGPGGRAYSSPLSSGWIDIWLIAGAQEPIAGLIDKSGLAPIMPDRYTLKKKVGSLYYHYDSKFSPLIQRERKSQIIDTGYRPLLLIDRKGLSDPIDLDSPKIVETEATRAPSLNAATSVTFAYLIDATASQETTRFAFGHELDFSSGIVHVAETNGLLTGSVEIVRANDTRSKIYLKRLDGEGLITLRIIGWENNINI